MATRGKPVHKKLVTVNNNPVEVTPDESLTDVLVNVSKIANMELPYELKRGELQLDLLPGDVAGFIYGALHTVKNSAKLNAEAELSRCRDLLNVRTQDYRRTQQRIPAMLEEARTGAFASVIILLESERGRTKLYPNKENASKYRGMLQFLLNAVITMVRDGAGNSYLAGIIAEATYGPMAEKYREAEQVDLMDIIKQEEQEILKAGLSKAAEEMLSQTEKDITEKALQEPFPGDETAQG